MPTKGWIEVERQMRQGDEVLDAIAAALGVDRLLLRDALQRAVDIIRGEREAARILREMEEDNVHGQD